MIGIFVMVGFWALSASFNLPMKLGLLTMLRRLKSSSVAAFLLALGVDMLFAMWNAMWNAIL